MTVPAQAIAVLAPVPTYTIYFVVQPMPGSLAIQQIVGDVIILLVVGVVVAMIKAILGQPYNGLRRFNSRINWTGSLDGPFGPGLLLDAFVENSARFLRRTRHWWSLSTVDVLTATATLGFRLGAKPQHEPIDRLEIWRPSPVPTEHEQLLLREQILRHQPTQATRPRQPGKHRNKIDQKDKHTFHRGQD